MDIERSLTFFKEDPRWKEKAFTGTAVLIISSVLSVVVIGILGFLIVSGYCVRLLQNVRDNQPNPLPEWDQWGDDLLRGFKLVVAFVVWALPSLVVLIPVVIGGILSDSRGAGEFFGGTLILCGVCLSVLYSIFVLLMSPGISIAFAEDEQVSSALQFTKIWSWTRENIGQVTIVTLVIIIASAAISLVASLVGALLCGIGLIITLPLASLATNVFQFHLYGQLAQKFPFSPAYSSASATSYNSTASYTPPADYTSSYTATPDAPAAPDVSSTPDAPDTPDTPSSDDPSSQS